ncbi:helix-turn-helix transcriptional regulator [Paenisporosarcina sp. OV554]|uniref:helix-turn-helix domain-containing protein n=1 Tax=Paenisporosarcina sp. OV554 TaxID=2135694 RepID=UPI000D3D8FDE|nr:helix-turn-helix transcriptional regulator [Paenisporosarcina sp. OV554]PUB12586.1 helix-turn-helix protein [Paenisporosarcina sp. OV554]
MLQISLAAARVNVGLRQKQAALLIGVSEKTLGGYERGQSSIPGPVLQKAAKIYKIPSDYIRLSNVNDGKYDEEEKILEHTTV